MKHPIIVKYKAILIKDYALEFLDYIDELMMFSVRFRLTNINGWHLCGDVLRNRL
jgi:hypothetical protein